MRRAALAIVLCAFAPSARAGDASAVLVPQPVRAPVAPGDVTASEPFVPASVPEVTGRVTLDAQRAAALWLDPFDVVIVRHDRSAKLGFARIVGIAGTRASITETGVAASATVTYLTQPAGRGDVWLISTAAATTITVERPVVRSGRFAWDDTQRALLDWVDRGGERPALPIADGSSAVAARLDAEARIGALAEQLVNDDGVRSAVRAWRKAGVVAGITTVRPFVTPQLAVQSLDDLDGMGGELSIPDPDVAAPRPYHRVRGPRTIEVDLTGPGALRVELRGILPASDAASPLAMTSPPAVSLAVSAGGQRLAARSLAAGYATVAESAAPRAFPKQRPLVASEGSYLGERLAVAIPLYPGTHRYSIAVAGGELALRATVARRRVRLGEAIGGSDDVDRFLSRGRGALDDERSSAGALVRRLLDARAGAAPAAAAVPKELPPLLRLAWIATLPAPDARAITASLRDIPAADRDAGWALVVQLVTRARTQDHAVLSALAGQPPAAMIPELVAALPAPSALERMRNWQQSALDLAWRTQPLDPALGFADRAAWRGGEWALIAPTPRDDKADMPQPQRWLVEARATGAEQVRAWRAGDLWKLAVGRKQTVIAAPSTIDPARAALLDIYVAAPAQSALELTVDDRAFHAVALANLERLQVAVPPGRHEIRLDAPAGTTAWASHAPAGSVRGDEVARVQYYWPVGGMRTVLPTEAASSPVQIALRAVGTKPLRVVMRSDVGTPTEIELAPGTDDATAHPLAAAPAGGASISAAVRLPPGSRMVWFETDEPERLLAAVFVRRARADAMPTAPAKSVGDTSDALARLTEASRKLARDPDDARARAERASELLDLGEPTLAREDLLRLLRVPPAKRGGSASIEDELFARLEGFAEPTHIALLEPVKAPVPIAPSLLALANDRAIADSYAAARGNADKLVELYQETGVWQVAFEALEVAARGHERSRSAVVYGLASRLRGILDHPRVRRAQVVSAALTGWATLTATTGNAGQETLFSTEPTLPPAPPVVIREALIAPPWPARSGHTLTSSTTASLELDAPGATGVYAQVKCVATRTRVGAERCSLTARIDQGTPRSYTIKRDSVAELDLGTLAGGRHVVEVGLSAGSEGDVASLRFVADRAIAGVTAAGEAGRFPIEIERRGKVFVATHKAPITTTVLGDSTLWIQARAVDKTGRSESGPLHSGPGASAARTVEVVATPAKGEPVRATITLAQDRSTAHADGDRSLVVSVPADAFLLLPDAVAYQISVTPDRGEIVARLARREERAGGKVPRTPDAWYADAPAVAAAFALPSPPAVAPIAAESFAEPSPGRVGTLAVELGIGQDNLVEEDLLPARVRSYGQVAVGHRRTLAIDRAWLTSRALVRRRDETELIAGGSSELYLAHLPLSLTAQLRGSAMTQAFSMGRAWHVRGDARLGRPVIATSTLTVLPSLGFAYSWLNTTPAAVEVTTEEIDPEVFTKYRYAHDRTATARLALRWMPLQDFVATLAVGAASNRDLRSADHVDAAVRVQQLLPLPLLGDTYLSVGYHPRYRLGDADRMEGFLQHHVSSRIEWSVWTGRAGRFLLGVWNELDVTPTSTLPAFGASLRFELVGHRGLVDYAPDDAVFSSLLERRDYAPLEPP